MVQPTARRETVYYRKSDPDFDLLQLLRASSSLPFIAPIVEYGGRKLLDGGISDPIPLGRAESDGYKRNLLILTRNEDYRKSAGKFGWIVQRAYRKYPKLVEQMLGRHERYNGTLDYIVEQERRGTVFVIRPQETLVVGRMERDPAKLDALYKQGYEDAKRMMPQLREWMEG